jgi:hypothetical protein
MLKRFLSHRGLLTAAFVFFVAQPAFAECRKVGSVDSVKIDAAVAADLAKIGLNREKLFDSIKEVSLTETSGCWGGAAGDFDDQLVSVGALQWNYGQRSLPGKLVLFRARTGAEFESRIAELMPQHGKLIFSKGCLLATIQDDCRQGIRALMNGKKLSPSLEQEFNSLFETDTMIQIQMDAFAALVQSVRDDLKRLFPNSDATPRRIQWAIDSKVQMAKPFPGDATVLRVRNKWDTADTDKKKALLALVDWYTGLARSIDQGGTSLDVRCNDKHWREKISAGVTNEQADLLNLSFLASRQSGGQEGYWQALTFQRHAKIILGVGSVAGNRVGIPNNSSCLQPETT